jgi:hypothetical protein
VDTCHTSNAYLLLQTERLALHFLLAVLLQPRLPLLMGGVGFNDVQDVEVHDRRITTHYGS